MSRLGNLFGSLYDPTKQRRVNSVVNANPTGIAGQAASFAAAQQAEQQRQAQRLQEAQAAANQQQQAVEAEAAAARQRQEQARSTALQEQEFKLRQQQFENDRAIQQQELEEQKRAARAQEAFRQGQQAQQGRLNRGSNPMNQIQFGSLTGGTVNSTNRLGTQPGNMLLAGRKPGQMLQQQMGMNTGRRGRMGAFGNGRAGAFE